MADHPNPSSEPSRKGLSQPITLTGEQLEMAQEWAKRLASIDRGLRNFNTVPKEQKSHAAEDLGNSFGDLFKSLNGVIYGSDPSTRYLTDGLASERPNNLKFFPRNIAQTLNALAGQSKKDLERSPLYQIGSRLQQIVRSDFTGQGSVWDQPEGRLTLKQVQKLWTETRPRIETILAEPAVLDDLHGAKLRRMFMDDARKAMDDAKAHTRERVLKIKKEAAERGSILK